MKGMMGVKMENVGNGLGGELVFNVVNMFVCNVGKEVDVKGVEVVIEVVGG